MTIGVILSDGIAGIPLSVVIPLAIVLIVLIWVVATYNGLVNIRQLSNESFSGIDTELQRRHDLIPNLVEIVKGYAKHERELFEQVAAVRSRAIEALSRIKQAPGRPLEAARAGVLAEERHLSVGLGNILVVAERYPELKASQNFRDLMRELANTEDRIQAARRFYNANVRELNNRCQQFPSNLIAGMWKFEQRAFFELENPLARVNVNVAERF